MRKLWEIAEEILHDWRHMNYAANPYVKAMRGMDYVTDYYYCDGGQYIVSGFLANAGTWRGETARRIKLELKEMLKDLEDVH